MSFIRFKDITIPSTDGLPEEGRYAYRNISEDTARVLRIRSEDTPTAVMYVLLCHEIRMKSVSRKELLRAVEAMTGDDPKDFEQCVEEDFDGLWSIRVALVYRRSTDFNVIYDTYEKVYEEGQ